MKIKNTEEANKYYDIINTLIDKYITEWNILPSKLFNYIKVGNKKFTNFLERNGLNDIDGIKIIINDVIEDRRSMELDGVLKYEKFSNENKIGLNLLEPDISYEKVLADFYHTSLGHIELKNKHNHIYSVKDFGKNIHAIILSSSDMDTLKKSVINLYGKKIVKSVLKIEVQDIEIDIPIKSISTNKQIREELKSKIDSELISNYISNVFKNDIYEYKFKEEYKSYFIFEKKHR